MKILYLSQRFPYPPDRGDRIPTFNHIKYLSRFHKVHVASLIADKAEFAHLAGMQEWAASVTVEHHPRWRSFFGKVRAFFAGEPLSLGHYRNGKLRRRLHALIAEEGIEAVVVFSSSMAQYVEPLGKLVRIMNFCDLDSQKWADLSKTCFWPRSWIYRREARLLLKYERKIAADFDGSSMVTENEVKLFRNLIPGLPVSVVANGVDFAYFGAVERKPADLRFTFVGVMDYEPNVEAVDFFVREVWPLVRERYPEARFDIVGSRPNRRVAALAGTPGVRVTGFVPDVRTFLSDSTMVVVPLKVARGIQNKILEAMAAGVPVLTTPAAAGGLPASAHEVLSIAERRDPADFFQSISAMLENRAAMEEKAVKARAFVKAHFSWDKSGESLDTMIFDAKMARDTRPALAPAKNRVSAL